MTAFWFGEEEWLFLRDKSDLSYIKEQSKTVRMQAMVAIAIAWSVRMYMD